VVQIEIAVLDLSVKLRQHVPEIRTIAHPQSSMSQDASMRARSMTVHFGGISHGYRHRLHAVVGP
jgi:hypothetical protein